MNKIIGYDIETIPQPNLSKSQQEFLDNKVRLALLKEPNADVKALTGKIMGTSPYLGEIVCIGLGEVMDNNINTKALIGTEKKILEDFWMIMDKLQYATFVSFNGLNFDVNFIMLRSLKNGVRPTNKAFLGTKRFTKHPHFDIMQWMSGWGYPAPTLDIACDICDVKTSKEGAVKASEVAQAYKDGRIQEIADYCEEDVRATLQVYAKLRTYIKD